MLFKSYLSATLFAAAALAKIQFTSTPPSVNVGKTYQVTWSGGDTSSPATIILRKGVSTNLGTVETLTTSGVGGSFSWSPKEDLTDGSDYALEIVQGTDTNYSGQFAVSGGSGTATSFPTGSAAITSNIAAASTSDASASASASASGSISSAASSASASASSSIESASASSSSASASASASSASASSAAATSSAAGSSTSASTRPSTSSTSVPASGASGLQSPMAFIFCAVAAMLYFS